jgi:hypothetical protein
LIHTASLRTGYEVKRIALAAAGAAIAGLAACSHAAAPAAAPASHRNAPVPVSCSRQYDTWQHGQGKGVIAALHAVSAASAMGATHALTAALQKARPAVVRAARHPVPACADPMGYWDVLLMHLNAAAASGSSASSARAAMSGVPQIEHELTVELKHTAR